MSVVHRVPLPLGATPLVEVGASVDLDAVLATLRPPGSGLAVPVAAPLRRSTASAGQWVVVAPGTSLQAGDVLARDPRGREVRVAEDCLFLAYDAGHGTALVATLGPMEPILGHVRGDVTAVQPSGIELRVSGAVVPGIGGSGGAIHGELRVAVADPGDELRAGAIDVAATGRIVVGGSRASAETLTRARAMGVAGIVLGGLLDKELRDFEAAQQRRREVGGVRGDFAILLLEGFGKVALDPALFAWFRSQEGRMASLFGDEARLYVYDADPPPARRALPRAGDRVIAHRRPHAGRTGELVRILDGLYATPGGLMTRSALVRFEDGRGAIVPLANVEATDPLAPDPTAGA